jgi:hypothetical protein
MAELTHFFAIPISAPVSDDCSQYERDTSGQLIPETQQHSL